MTHIGIKFMSQDKDGLTIVEAETPNRPDSIGHVHYSLRRMGIGIEHASIRVIGNRVVQRLKVRSRIDGPQPLSLQDACLEALGSMAFERRHPDRPATPSQPRTHLTFEGLSRARA